jgi:hypothetical protein
VQSLRELGVHRVLPGAECHTNHPDKGWYAPCGDSGTSPDSGLRSMGAAVVTADPVVSVAAAAA